jgi:hypothetical protein
MCVTLHDCVREVNPLLSPNLFMARLGMFIGEEGRIGRGDLFIGHDFDI